MMKLSFSLLILELISLRKVTFTMASHYGNSIKNVKNKFNFPNNFYIILSLLFKIDSFKLFGT